MKIDSFRKMTDEELELARKPMQRGRAKIVASKVDKVAFATESNFTVAIVKRGKTLYVGVSKRNPTDKPDFGVAKNIALFRAVSE